MKKTKYPRIQVRLLIGMLIIILSSSIISISYFRDIKKLKNVTNDIIEHPFAVSNSVRNIDIYINAMHRSMKDVVLAKNEMELNQSIDLVNKNEQVIYANFEIVKEKFLGDLELVNDVYATFVDWKPIRDEVIALVMAGGVDEAAKITKEKGNKHIELLLTKTRLMIDFANEKALSFNQNSIKISEQAKRNSFLFTISTSILGIVFFLWIFHSIANPINSMIHRIKMVSGNKAKGFSLTTGNGLAVLDYAISEFETREKDLADQVNKRTKELKESQDLLEDSIDNATIGMVEVALDGVFINANRSFCDTIGYSVKELRNLTFNDITVEDDKGIGEEYLRSALEGKEGKSNLKVEKRYVHKSGRIIYTSLSALVVRDKNKKPLHLFSQISDITKQKEYEKELTKHKAELDNLIKERTSELNEKASKLGRSQQALTFLLEDVNDIKKQLKFSNSMLVDANKELEAFSYSVSHDLKAPLRAVIGFSQILQEDYAPQLDAESNRYIDLIKNNAENMGTLINDLLSFSRMGRTVLHKSQVDLGILGQRVKGELMIDNQDRELSINFTDMPVVNADEKLMYHVMLNLISNAVKFTSKVEHALVEIGCTIENNDRIFYVKDNGVGFDMKYAGRIFDVFQRLHTVDEFPGTGIGLSIVQRIIHKHEGRVWVESELNKGTTFFFTL